MDSDQRQALEVACRLLGKSIVNELEIIQTQKFRLYYQAKDAYDSLRNEAIWEATKKIDAQLKDEKEEVNKLCDAYTLAKRDVEEAKVIQSTKKGYKASSDETWTVGTKVKLKSHRGWGGKIVYGVIEVYTNSTILPERTADYRKPSVGSFFVRICKKDGTPGKKIDTDCYAWERATE